MKVSKRLRALGRRRRRDHAFYRERNALVAEGYALRLRLEEALGSFEYELQKIEGEGL